MKRTIRERILNPKPNSKVAAAIEFGIDLTLNIRKLKISPEQRILENFQSAEQFEILRQAMKQTLQKNRVKRND
jgi:hypothetical protein